MRQAAWRGLVWRSGSLPVMLLFAALLISLYLLSNATEGSATIGPFYSWLLLGNALGLLTLTAILGYQLYQLFSEYRQQRAGIRLTLRMVVMFVILAVVPVSLVYLLSVQFLQRGIDSWFDVRIEAALGDSLELSRDAMASRIREHARTTSKMAESLADRPTSLLTLELIDMRVSSGAHEIALLDTNGRLYAFTNIDESVLVPNMPSEMIYSQLRHGYPYLDMEMIEDRGFFIRNVIAIPDTGRAGLSEKRLLQALFPVPERQNVLAQSVQSAIAAYKELSYIRDDLKRSFIMTLSLALFLNILTAVIVAVISARRMAAPIRDLVDGTQAVALGNYDMRLPIKSRDELGMLVRSFNDMTQKIAETSEQARTNQARAEEEHAYVQAILSRLSTGVITLDARRRVMTMNPTAERILDLYGEKILGRTLDELVKGHAELQGLAECLNRNLDSARAEWQEQLVLLNRRGRQILMINGTLLAPEHGHKGEHVIMFDDITALVQAQRSAAWGEMARRLAHEIKNPLTPIQLSAERVRHKCLGQAQGPAAEVMDKATNTIIAQVESMKDMVNAFTQYARSPELRIDALRINVMIMDVLEMYRGELPESRWRLLLDVQNPEIAADAGRIRQLLHNLIRNALDAMQGVESPRLAIETASDAQQVRLVISDNGCGFDEEIRAEAFEPYITTKESGTGLGLAIVNKIIEEHNGEIVIGESPSGGASITIRLPRATEQRNTSNDN